MTGFMAAVRGVLRHPTVRLLLGTAALTTGLGLLQALSTDVAEDLAQANTELKHKTADLDALKAEIRDRKRTLRHLTPEVPYPTREDVDPLGHAQADDDDWHPAPAGAESSDAG